MSGAAPARASSSSKPTSLRLFVALLLGQEPTHLSTRNRSLKGGGADN